MHTCQLTLVKECYRRRVCNVCNTTVTGLSYTCRACDFDCHPLCAHPSYTVPTLLLSSTAGSASASHLATGRLINNCLIIFLLRVCFLGK
ncbi:hypothetical protein VNO78_15779 [Psophocarpus tetragonolobus]|uniref:DC1 domain-containing protein n=1 Tax=Psophocarpus tetragonolobus TaxID=3891 RepID=A0AAN9XK75_PSOTE